MLLITGAGGQLGRATLERCVELGIEFVAADRAELDITERASVAKFVKVQDIDCILNCAAYTAVDAAEDHIGDAYAVNAYAPHCLASLGIPVIHVSSDYVFNGSASTPYETDSPTDPLSVYGLSKRAGEIALIESGAFGLIVRTAWVYSACPEAKNFYNTMKRLALERDEVRVVSDQRGTPTLASDFADALLRLYLQGMHRERMRILHFTNAGESTWFDFASSIIAHVNPACRVTPIMTADYPTKAVRPAYSVLSLKSLADCGIHPRNWRDALESTFQD